MIDITEFLRRLTKKITSPSNISLIKVVFKSNGTEINIREVGDDGRILYAYGSGTKGPSKSWTPHTMVGAKYVISRIEEQRVNKSHIKPMSSLVRPINKAVIYVEKIVEEL